MKKIYVILLLMAISIGSLFAYDWYVDVTLESGNGYIETWWEDTPGNDYFIDYSFYQEGQTKEFTVSLWPPEDPVPNKFCAEGLGDYNECPAGPHGTHHYLYIYDQDGPIPPDPTIPQMH